MSWMYLCFGLFSFSISFAYENIALNKPAYQENPFTVLDEALTQASNAVDGLKSDLRAWGGQCVISQNDLKTATWGVNLTSILSIHHMRIYYRTGNIPWGSTNGFAARFLGFSVYVSNTTNKSEGILCFKDTNYTAATIPSVLNITCPMHGQYVIYYNERLSWTTFLSDKSRYAYNDLCEFEVYGCPVPGVYGTNCSIPCPDVNCRYCHIETGACQGCTPGYQGHRCELECTDGKYGEVCGEECGFCANLSYCNHVNGSCFTGCEAGYKGEFCRQECDIGTYGDMCNETCGNCQDQTKCHHSNGTCLSGCNDGFQGALCKTPCPYGFFGPGCIHKCYRNCRGCNTITGTCETSCFPGWKGTICAEECDNKMFGDNCTEPCGHCLKSEQCHHINGTCMNGCDRGYEGFNCTEECDDDHFGFNCEEMCNETCKTCNKTNGLCENGCFPGWKGLYCEQECDNRMFGENCTESCGNCLKSEQCHHINGTCMKGCDRGYQGFNCTEECDEFHYGFSCNETCNVNCKGCDRTTGECQNGCNPGWTGNHCQEVCVERYFGENCSSDCGTCFNYDACHHVNGSCLSGCIPGYQPPLCKEECSLGKYGLNCREKCGNCSDVSYCHKGNGTCLTGCSSGYKGPLCKEVRSTVIGNPPEKISTGLLVGYILGVLLAAILIVASVIIVRRKRRRNPNQEKYHPSSETKEEYGFDNHSNTLTPKRPTRNPTERHNSNYSQVQLLTSNSNENQPIDGGIQTEEETIYMNENLTADIPVDKLESAIAKRRAKGNELFKKEYADLPSGEIRKCDVGKLAENISKNRFKTTFPYDHSRVILGVNDGETSDYINANYIDGPHRPKEYIAAQGPKQNTLDDFWRMVWQDDVQAIVMLTNLKEAGKTKCTQYWPNENNCSRFGTFSVSLTEEKEYAFFIERKLSVSKQKKTRWVTQYHYTAWPDHGTPDPMNLLEFHHHVITCSTHSESNPTVVHCSAGVGRTGTYIALDALYWEGKQKGTVNVSRFVKGMRNNRVFMVQTYGQYITVFLALNEIFKAPMQMYSSKDFCVKTENAMSDKPANQNPLRNEFQLLLKVRPNYTEADYKMARQNYTNRQTDKALPLDEYTLYLSSMVPKRGSYINAISVPSFTKAKRFIVTHYPTPEDAVDFLRLLNDHDSDTVICLDPVHHVESIRSWLPEYSSSKVVAPFTVNCQSNSKNDSMGHVIQISEENQEDHVHTVVVLEPQCRIIPKETPVDTSDLLQLVTSVLSSETDNAITVVSSDGASLCGVFIAIHNAIQQLRTDSAVDVFTVVRQLQIRRPEFINSLEEYEMVNTAVYDYIQNTSDSIYSNQ
ncbi:uncharacterized protein LOC111114405 isoform X2 [Crassostrea virginica]